MANTPAVLSAPIGFVDSQGKEHLIPAAALSFDASNALQLAYGPLTGADLADATTFLEHLVSQGVIVAAAKPPPKVGLVITAKDPGSQTNNITLSVTAVHDDPTDATTKLFTATVTETDTYTGLTPATLASVIGSTAGGGTRPGLVFVTTATPAAPKNGTYTLGGTGPYTADVLKADNTTAFTLEGKANDAEAKRTTVSVVNDATGGTFTLTATWTKTATDIKVGDLAATFAYEITVAPAPGAAALAVPAPGTVQLSGGSDAAAARPASASVVAFE
ncbi:MAG TPA: hypothetical protein VHF47_09060 [Acidimicrobiales bacterium]|nr:hypothetical protein [Acidimicrobiales bacterium]